LRNAVAALSPPRAKAISNDSAKPMTTLDIECLMRSAALQKRLRCIVLQALTVWNRNWDAEQICSMLSRLHFLIERFERGGQVARALAGQQWQQIKCAVCIAERWSESAQDVSSLVAPSDSSLKRKRSINQDVTIRGYRPVQAGVYTPNPNIRALRCVEEGLVSIVLRCLVCAREITSKCFFVFRGSRQVLRPHRACCKDGGNQRPRVDLDVPGSTWPSQGRFGRPRVVWTSQGPFGRPRVALVRQNLRRTRFPRQFRHNVACDKKTASLPLGATFGLCQNY
jgi:hypothetical protein